MSTTNPTTTQVADAALLKESLRLAVTGNMLDVFYQTLFTAHPDIHHLFTHTNGDHQRALFASTLTAVVTAYDRPDELVPLLRDLGARHAGYGATLDGYAAFGRALHTALETALTDSGRVTPDRVALYLGAWERAIMFTAGTMLTASVYTTALIGAGR